jgi:GH24 family phage-related lysozyme (muramidase)
MLYRDEIIEEVQLINAWLSSHSDDDSTITQLTESRTALEAEFKRTGGRCRPTDFPSNPKPKPAHVSDKVIDRAMGKYAKQGDSGESCKEEPYVASPGEDVCTIGYGHQIRDIPCPVLDSKGDDEGDDEYKKKYAPNKPPSPRRIKIASPYFRARKPFPDFYCGCAGKKHFDCKGEQAKDQLKKDLKPHEDFVRANVPYELDQDQFDALVDLSISGSWGKAGKLLEAMKLYWCSDNGKNYIRSIFLTTGLTSPDSRDPLPGLIARRKILAWGEKSPESIPGDNPPGPTVQPKLIVGRSDDIYELEADRIADEVMRMPDKETIRDNNFASRNGQSMIQRKEL